MVNKESRQNIRVKKHARLRNRFSGTAERPRLAVFRSNNHMYAQIIDDVTGNTLVSASSNEKTFKEYGGNKDAAREVGKVLAERAVKKDIKTVVFDRGGYVYQGRVAELAEGAREGGLEF